MIFRHMADEDEIPRSVIALLILIAMAIVSLLVAPIAGGIISTFGIVVMFKQCWAWSTLVLTIVLWCDHLGANRKKGRR